MAGERKHISKQSDYGTLNMRSYVIFGNDINAFYDKSDDLVFVLDNTVNSHKPNVLLVMNPDGDRKWDEILSDDYMVELENVRPKQDNKYQKLDIEYSGLAVYENLINAYNAGEDLTEYLAQLDILRDSASKHSAMNRLNAANEIIARTNNTIVKTKETIADLQMRLKTLRSKLSAQKKEIGKIPTKQSAAKILKTESQIEAINEKIKRAKKRLESAQRRLEIATNDAEIASAFLNQPSPDVKHVAPKSKSVVVAPKYEMQTTDEDDNLPAVVEDEDTEEPEEESDIKPLFDSDPEIIDEDIAFKPISFEEESGQPESQIPALPELPEPMAEKSDNDSEDVVFAPVSENMFEQKAEEPEPPVFESFDSAPVLNAGALLGQYAENDDKPVLDSMRPVPEPEQKPMLESMTPVAEEEITEQQPINITPVVTEFEAPVLSSDTKEPEKPVVQPVVNTFNAPVEAADEHSKPTFTYYLLLIVLIVLSVFTLWLYQKHTNISAPVLTPKTAETTVAEQPKPVKLEKAEPVQVALPDVVEETVFLDEFEEPEPQIVEEEPTEEMFVEKEPVEEVEEPVYEEEPSAEEIEPIPEETEESDEEYVEPVVNKPEYGAGSKHDKMFVVGEDTEMYADNQDVSFDEEYDEEEAAYQAELASGY